MIGIYKITNLINGKVYVGKSVNIENRFSQHKKNIYLSKHNDHFKRSLEKYGIENFSFEVLRECKEEDLNCLEQFYIRVYCSFDNRYGYNKTYGGDGGIPTNETKEILKKNWKYEKHFTPETKQKMKVSRSKWRHSEETKKKISESNKGKVSPNKGKITSNKTKEKIRQAITGIKRSEETKKKISENSKLLVGERNGMFGKKHSNETIEKIKKSLQGKFNGEKNPMFGTKYNWYNNGIQNKRIKEDDMIPDNFIKGYIFKGRKQF